ncbi:MAG TPA: preprotein translocase subunit SecE [Anaerohalosphaeraceae bacterium]|jgi:preprotein translocase SecE subunit|nr:preprotein translocase subunit SecE [Anaerohalosphaeraceae bacterium]HPB92021.1 preprotein translocase subunit SecE [Anaerohalosphaeraceae bacterium]HRT22727.1 preprotein translocase subunit SecE [Anaerohalosphaeraceae bacterium]HRU14235.1 preprotein translocase subunit SecE [Anaerohalosphaeraceae bacterium]
MGINQIYKRGQGTYTRLGTGVGVFVLIVIGCAVLYQHLAGQSILIQTLVPSVLCVVLSWLTFWVINKPAVSDFLIAAESEIKKVSWSSRHEIIVSTTVVIVVVILMSIGLAVVDLFFNWFFGSVIGLF